MNNKEKKIEKQSSAERLKGLSPEKRKLLLNRLGSKGDSQVLNAPEPIAVIGMSCRFPGGADSPAAFWKLLSEKRDMISEMSKARWRFSLLDKEQLSAEDNKLLRWGGFIDDIDKFDPTFFDISPREAATMDPQQRLAMEVAWEALESAGQTLQSLNGMDAGIFLGLHSESSDYYWMQLAAPGELDIHAATGGAHSIAANRLSYFLDLKGPSMAVDTACSSSLVAVHLACQSLRSQECEMALAGGVNLILSPENSYAFSKLQFLSPDGRCKTFDAGANGYVRGEGCGVIVLRRLGDAIKDGDPILALIRGSAVNQDGASNGLTAPSGLSQQAVVKQALKNAKVSPDRISFVETHGTGTALGDPIEVEALVATLGGSEAKEAPCRLGAVKTNIGHLEAAAGIAGLIKIVLCMQHKSIPANLHFNELNPNISLDESRFEIPVTSQDWVGKDGERFAGVSSFGFGGTNAHIILQDPPESNTTKSHVSEIEEDAVEDSSRVWLLPLSARSEESLVKMVDRWQGFLSGNQTPSQSLKNICYTAAVRRTHHGRCIAGVGANRDELIESLEKGLNGHRAVGDQKGGAKENRAHAGGLVFVFSGQGPQWYGMGRLLLSREPVYRDVIERCDAKLKTYANWSLLDELQKDEKTSRLNQTEIAQPALFALQMGLASLWGSWGIFPDAIVGHSVGEVAAACFSGILTLKDAIKVIYHRGRLLQRITGHGRMAAVNLTPEDAETLIADYQGRLTIAAINSPTSITLTGAEDALDHMLRRLAQKNIVCLQLPVDYAFHSPQTDVLMQEMIDSATGIETRPASISIMSTVTGISAGQSDYSAAYWAENIRRPVKFAQAVDGLITGGYSRFLEIGPHPVLALPISQCLASRNVRGNVLPSLRREKNDTRTLLESLGKLYILGEHIEWPALYPKAGHTVQLPSYPWHKKSYWIQSPGKEITRRAIPTFEAELAVIGHPIRSKNLSELVIEFEINPRMSHVRDHLLFGDAILPASVILQMCESAVLMLFGKKIGAISEFYINQMLKFSDGIERKLQVIFKVIEADTLEFEFVIVPHSPTGVWETLADGKVWMVDDYASGKTKSLVLAEFQELAVNEIGGDSFYRSIEKVGVRFGPSYHSVASVWLLNRHSFARFHNPSRLPAAKGCKSLDPAIFDSALLLLLQSRLAFIENGGDHDPYLFVGFEKLELYNQNVPPSLCKAEYLGQIEDESFSGNIILLDDSDSCIARITGARLKRAFRKPFLVGDRQPASTSVFSVTWKPSSLQDFSTGLNTKETALDIGFIRANEENKGLGSMPEEVQFQQNRLSSELNHVCTAGIIRCCLGLGWNMSPGSVTTLDAIILQTGVKKQYRRLFARMIDILVEDGILVLEGSFLKVDSNLDIVSPKVSISELLTDYPEYKIELGLLQKCLHELPNVIAGESDPVDLLFPGGSIELAEDLYRNSPVFRYNNATVAKIVSSISDRIPSNRTINILEIGAGTGGTTSHILPVLTERKVNYVFTDVSNYFLDKIKQRFSIYPFVSFDILDIEKEVLARDTFFGKFDIVIAANVLHATKNLKNTLQNVLGLTALNGLLILIEGVRPARWIDMIFGLTSGWWLFSDSNLRDKHPLLTEKTWAKLLKETGFRDPVVYFNHNENNNVLFRQAVILAQADRETDQKGIYVKDNADETTKTSLKRQWLVLYNSPLTWSFTAALDPYDIECTWMDLESANDLTRSLAGFTEGVEPNIDGSENFGAYVYDAVLYVTDGDHGSRSYSTDEIYTITSLICSRLARLVNIFLNRTQPMPPKIWIVTRGAHAVIDNEEPDLRHSSVWGIGRVLAAEHPDLWGGLIDLDPACTGEESVTTIVNQVIHGANEKQAAFRGGQRYIPSLSLLDAKSPSNLVFENKTFLITGGLGALGLKTARWLAEKGAGKLILISRKTLPDRSLWSDTDPYDPSYEKISRIRQIESFGAVVKIASIDVADRSQLEPFLTDLSSEGWRPVSGVVHAAGTLRDEPIYQLSSDSLKEVLRPKMIGALLLDKLLSSDPVEFYIYFSSIGALLGQKGQASYASANVFLDAMAAFQRANYKNALSINWGPWEKAGFSVTTGAEKTIVSLSRHGIVPIEDSQAFKAMDSLLKRGDTQGAIFSTKWTDFANVFPQDEKTRSLTQLYSSIRELDETFAQDEGTGKTHELLNSLMSMAPGPERRDLMESHLAGLLEDVLAMDKKLVKCDEPFGNMGLDSLMALEFKSRCEQFYGVKLPATLVWRYPTIRVLSTQLAEMIGISLDIAVQEEKKAQHSFTVGALDIKEDFLQRIDHLSDQEALHELLRKK